MPSVGGLDAEWVARECEQAVAEMVVCFPWMGGPDVVAVLREVFTAHFGMVAGVAVDLGRMAGNCLMLSEWAGEVGDVRREWAFDQWYQWTCAAMRGEEYDWPDLPPQLGGL